MHSQAYGDWLTGKNMLFKGACEDYLLYFVGLNAKRGGKRKMRYHYDF